MQTQENDNITLSSTWDLWKDFWLEILAEINKEKIENATRD